MHAVCMPAVCRQALVAARGCKLWLILHLSRHRQDSAASGEILVGRARKRVREKDQVSRSQYGHS